MSPIQYTLNGLHQIVMLPATSAAYVSDPEVTATVRRVAQSRADNTGAPCEVWSSDDAGRRDYVFAVNPSHE